MHARQSRVWYKAVPDVIRNYNHSYHSGIRTEPALVTPQNEAQLWRQQYLPPKDQKKKPKPYSFKIGDVVRVSFLKSRFTRHYDQGWTDQLYIVAKRFRRDNIPIYRLNNYENTSPVDGSFYSPELQSVAIRPDTLFHISEILKTKTINGKKFSLVSWKGWDSSYNSYIANSELKRFK